MDSPTGREAAYLSKSCRKTSDVRCATKHAVASQLWRYSSYFYQTWLFLHHSYAFVNSDILRRVSIVIHQHILNCEQRFANATPDTSESGLFHTSKMVIFDENKFLLPQYVYHFVRAPVSRMGFLYGIKPHEVQLKVPDLSDIHTFLRELFLKAQLTAECSIGRNTLFFQTFLLSFKPSSCSTAQFAWFTLNAWWRQRMYLLWQELGDHVFCVDSC